MIERILFNRNQIFANDETMSDELLTKETKFRQLNGELERKTKELMKEVNSVVNGSASASSALSVYEEHLARQLSRKNVSNADQVSEKGSKSSLVKCIQDSRIANARIDKNGAANVKSEKEVNKDDTTIFEDPVVGNNSSNEAMVRFFESKSKILHGELEMIKLEYKKKCDYSNELATENKKIVEERAKLHGQIDSLKDGLSKLETINAMQSSDLQKGEIENSMLRKEIDTLKKSLKTTNQQMNNYNLRLNRSLEDNERLRKALKCCQLEEKELREDIRKLEEEKRAALNIFEKQRTELLHAFRKQSLLVDNLKKQKIYLEANMHVKYAEEELVKLLDWKLDKV